MRKTDRTRFTRSKWLATVGALPLAASIGSYARVNSTALPDKSGFRLPGIYLNAAYTHPMSVDVAAATKDYVDMRMTDICHHGRH